MEKLSFGQKKKVIDVARKAYEIAFEKKLEEEDFWTKKQYFEENLHEENIYFEGCGTMASLIHHIMKVKYGLSDSQNQIIDCTFSVNGYRYAHTYNLVLGEPIDATIDQFKNRTNMSFSIYENNMQYYENNVLNTTNSDANAQREISIFNHLDRELKKGDLGVKAVVQLGKDYCLKNNSQVVFKIGETFTSETGCSYCSQASETLEYYEFPFAMKYLEIKILSEPWRGDDEYSCFAHEIKVIREIPFEELRQDPLFNEACITNKLILDELQEGFNTQFEEDKAARVREEQVIKSKLNAMKKIVILSWMVPVVLLVILPIVLHYLGVI